MQRTRFAPAFLTLTGSLLSALAAYALRRLTSD